MDFLIKIALCACLLVTTSRALAELSAVEHATVAMHTAMTVVCGATSSAISDPNEILNVVGQRDYDELAKAVRDLRGASANLAFENRPGFEDLLDMFVRIQRRHEDALRNKCVRTAGQLAGVLLKGPLGEGITESTRELIAHLARVRGLHQQTMVRLLNEGLDKVIATLHVKDISPEELKSELARRENSSMPLVRNLHMTMIRNFILQDLLEKGLYRIDDKSKQLEYLSTNLIPYLAMRTNAELKELSAEITQHEHPTEIETLFLWAIEGVMKGRQIEGREPTKTDSALLGLMKNIQLDAAKEYARADGVPLPGALESTTAKAPLNIVHHAAPKNHADSESVVPGGSLRYEDAKHFSATVLETMKKFEKEKLQPLYSQLHKIVDVKKDKNGKTHYVRRTGAEADRAQAELIRDWGSDLPWMMSAERATTLTAGKQNPWGIPVTSLGAVMAVAASQAGPDGKRVIHFPSNPSHDIVLPNDTDRGIVTALSAEEPAASPVHLASAGTAPYGSGAGVYDTSYGNESFNNDRPSTANGFNKGYAPQTAASDAPKGLFPQKAEREALAKADDSAAAAAPAKAPESAVVPPAQSNSFLPNGLPKVEDSHRGDAPGFNSVDSAGAPPVATNLARNDDNEPRPIRRPARVEPRALPFRTAESLADISQRPRRAPVRNLAAPPDSFGEASARSEEANWRADAPTGRTDGVPAAQNEPPPQAYIPPPIPAPPTAVGQAKLPQGASGGEAIYNPGAGATPESTSPPTASVPTTTSIDTTVATDDSRRPVRTTTVVLEAEVGTGKPVKKTVKETQLEPETQKPTKVTETTTEYEPVSHQDKKITKIEMELDAASQRTTKVTETVREFDAKTHNEATVTKTVTDMDPAVGKPRIRVQTVKVLDPKTHNATKVTVVTSQIDVATQRITQRTTTASEYEPKTQKLLSKTTRVQYGDQLTKKFSPPVTAGAN